MKLDAKVAIVTGGGKGIGKAISLAFAREGANVAVADISEPALKEVAAEIEAMGGESLAVVADLARPEQPSLIVDRTLEKFGKIDVLVNNCGIEGPTVSVADMDLEEWNQVLAVNLTGMMLCAKHALKKSMIRHQSGVIINISSGMGRKGVALRSPYSASKWGVIGFSQALAWEVGKYGIRVNCIVPGPVEGERLERVFRERSRVLGIAFEEIVESAKARSPLNRLPKAEEVAALAVFLASEESSGIIGQAINCCTGIYMS